MDYNLETLGDERFQKLCQSLLVSSFPNVQCLPVGQPDGGRDAFLREKKGFLVFQVKYSRDPSSKSERLAIEDVIKSEKAKVDRLIGLGAKAFYLLTNVSGTAHLDAGSVDIINARLTEAFGIPSHCWWRDDIERRIEGANGLIWRYPEIFRGSDFLEMLAGNRALPLARTKASTFRACVAHQYTKDSEVRFQQVQIQNSLLDLFTDTPLGIAREKIPAPEVCNVGDKLISRLSASMQHYRYGIEAGDESLAANWLLAAAPMSGVQRIVLEGAPGQGKSTVTQYIAQLHRMRALRRQSDIEKVLSKHLDNVVRIPLRVDLRDYATWLNGKDPFAAEKDVARPVSGIDTLESFLSHQVFRLSGGREFTVDDLTATLTDSHCLLFLDGFDEVADKLTRQNLIEQIRDASDRLENDCISMQVIVTSRPAAFILSPGFPEREWLHLSLLPMRMPQISEYTDKWIKARNFPLIEGREFKELLTDRVSRSHIRSLAQNPMQLAILLSLISTKGRSLPDKRTALYDSYMDLFFGREAEKDETVRENRDVLMQIHQYVAWTLQLDAEKPGGSGSISQSDLEALVRNFLVEREHEGDVLKLFTGAVERVGALVSRVQGMLEFEVQPLREYFTGRFLYETAPYSPPGAEKGGTRPQRFDAIARRPYWLNVTRFYAGCYNSGELSSLVAGLRYLAEGADLATKSHVLQLATLFVNDWVFSQEPRTVRDVVSFLTEGENLKLVVSSRSSWDEDRLTFPEKAGRREFANSVTRAFEETDDRAYQSRLGFVLRRNATYRDRWTIWEHSRQAGMDGLFEASALGLFHDGGPAELAQLFDLYGDRARIVAIASGQWEDLSQQDRVHALKAYAGTGLSVEGLARDGRASITDGDLYRAYAMLDPNMYRYLNYEKSSAFTFEEVISRYNVAINRLHHDNLSESSEPGLHDILSAASRSSRLEVPQWRSSLEPWSDFVESLRRTWGDRPRMICIAAVGAGIKSKEVRAAGFDDVLDVNQPLVERARHARLRPSVSWWRDALSRSSTTDEKVWVLTLLLSWAPGGVIRSLRKGVERVT
ncbi:NACHT domain-containing protein [Sphingomonas endophytica]|uniref:NACHT domain-containing protein n=1 Tax=Sphingomonas endophytica TaxID=869719 RepID=UPI000A9D46C4|nr:hypothetical protein [Sphingomonas endophytica]